MTVEQLKQIEERASAKYKSIQSRMRTAYVAGATYERERAEMLNKSVKAFLLGGISKEQLEIMFNEYNQQK